MLCVLKLAKQSYDIVSTIIKGGGDGAATPEMMLAVGYPANEGWYATTASPHITEEARMTGWMAAYKDRHGVDPNDYAITACDAATMIIAAIKAASEGGKEPTRSAVRDAIQVAKVDTLQGPVSFDENGDLAVWSRIVMVQTYR